MPLQPRFKIDAGDGPMHGFAIAPTLHVHHLRAQRRQPIRRGAQQIDLFDPHADAVARHRLDG